MTGKKGQPPKQVVNARPSYLSVNDSAIALYEEVSSLAHSSLLGDFAKIQIGIVTGANPFFVISRATCAEAGISEKSVIPIFSRFKAANGLAFDQQDFEKFIKDGGRGYLIHAEKKPNPLSPLGRYFSAFPADKIQGTATFKRRSCWHSPNDGKIPNAFFPVMHQDGPRLILNNANINSTNTIHRVFFKDAVDGCHAKLLSISLLTSYSQLSSEFVGRRYGSGVLKHEPRDAEKIRVIIPTLINEEEIQITFNRIDFLLRNGNPKEAQDMADMFIFSEFSKRSDISTVFSSTLQNIRNARKILTFGSVS